MRYEITENKCKVFLEKQFDYEPEYSELFPSPESIKSKINVGIWEDDECSLETNVATTSDNITGNACKHFIKLADITITYMGGNSRSLFYGYYPRVLVAFNEGGHCSTGVCVDCLLEKLS